jgi:hypothetical protein
MRGLSLISILNLHDRAKLEIKKEKKKNLRICNGTIPMCNGIIPKKMAVNWSWGLRDNERRTEILAHNSTHREMTR